MKRKLLITSIVLTVITLATYWQVSDHAFINLDDQAYIYENPRVMGGLTGSSVVWAFTSVDYFYWQPLTWLSHMLDVELFGMNPGGHHLSSVFIHTGATLLLLFFLVRLTGLFWQSAFVAALFALHPMHVESVAWAAERKDVLSAFFGFLSLLWYVEYKSAHPPSLTSGSLKFYLLSLLCFMLGLMSKPMLVTLPVIMLLVDYWLFSYPRTTSSARVMRSLLIEKAPFLVLSTASSVITIYGQNNAGAMPTLDTFPVSLRIENALITYVKYLLKTLYPLDLAVYYPMPASLPFWQVAGSLLTLVILTVTVVRGRGKYPYLAVGWFWFTITIFPVIGLTQAGFQSMADRFSYMPHVGLFIMIAWGAADATKRLKQQKLILALLASGVLLMSTAITWRQIALWKNSIVLFEHALKVTENNWMALNNLGKAYLDAGRIDDALWCFQESVKVKPSYTVALINLGAMLAVKNRPDEAVVVLTQALQIEPGNEKALLLLGNLPQKR
ncbi:MAG TPA: tetratricopeptide repeat protein [Desulfuromonadales bacterium]|nr:tetratricopeptide repeat protein [Desulfuromonadales bacterium]